MTRFEFQVEENFVKTRLEDYLCEKFPNLSKMYLRELVRDEKCEVNGILENRGHRLRRDDFIEIEVDLERETAMMPEAIPLEIVFEETEFLIVNKPAGMLVHPTHRDKNGTLLNALSYYLNSEFKIQGSRLENDKSKIQNPKPKIVRPGLIHRLDKQTSGLIVIAKTPRAHRILCEHWRRKLVEKKYLALVEGIVAEDSGTIIAPIGRFAELKNWDVKEDGKHSETRFQVRERFADTTLLELEPVTGRTNQLRIHCAFVGHPIIGDAVRGGREFSRLCLHAYRLAFWHPNGNDWLEFETDFEKFV
ncbi:MAG: RluA family pseudouridine synthase [Pyrinomonadaceae bacterium]